MGSFARLRWRRLIALLAATLALAGVVSARAPGGAALAPTVAPTLPNPTATPVGPPARVTPNILRLPLVYTPARLGAQFGVDFTAWVTVPAIYEGDFPAARAMGADWVRVYLPWHVLEPAPGAYDWGQVDPVFAAAHQAGLKPLAVVYGAPGWASRLPCGPVDDLDAYERFLRAAWARYGSYTRAWECCNEPDSRGPHWWGPIIGCWAEYPDLYARQLERFSRTLKSLDPGALIVLGGLAYDNWVVFERQFLDSILECGAGPWFDALNLHYYPINAVEFPTLASKVEELRAILAAHGADKEQIWVTETSDWVNQDGSLDRQRDFIVRQFTRGQAAGADVFFWFDASQHPMFDANLERWLITRDHQPDNAYFTYQYYARMVGGLECLGTAAVTESPAADLPAAKAGRLWLQSRPSSAESVDHDAFSAREGGLGLAPEARRSQPASAAGDSGDSIEAYHFRGPGRQVYILWSSDALTHTVRLSVAADALITDRDGVFVGYAAPQNGEITLEVGPAARYVNIPAASNPALPPTPTPGPSPTPCATLTPVPMTARHPIPAALLADETWALIARRVREAGGEAAGRFPETTEAGQWRYTADGGWTGGYWAGLLWDLYERTGDPQFRDWAAAACRALESRAADATTHDLGMIFTPSHAAGYRIMVDDYYRSTALRAADTLAARYNPQGRYIPAWGLASDPAQNNLTIIDTMMNLPLLWWAYSQSLGETYADAGVGHMITAARAHVRADGSTAQACELDRATGELIAQRTIQGYSDTSCWSRGQAWAIYGFALAGRRTSQAEVISAAEATSAYFLAHLPADGVPYWDFALPSTAGEPKDSSAAAIAACGLLELAESHPDVTARPAYWNAALDILESLTANYLNRAGSGREGILLHGCAHRPTSQAVDEALIWGDYYYVEALLRLWQMQAAE